MFDSPHFRPSVQAWGRLPLMIAAAVWCSAVVGCGGNENLATVTGQITLDGAPLSGAFVTFNPQGGAGSTSFGRTDADGRYEMMFSDDAKGAWIGENLVRIGTGDVAAPGLPSVLERVPAVYNARSNLLRKVEPGANQFDFELKSDAGKTVQVKSE